MNNITCAGHTFDLDDGYDLVCRAVTPSGNVCGVSFASIEHATESNLNQSGFAHIGALNEGELNSIRELKAKRDAIRQRMWDAVCGVSSK